MKLETKLPVGKVDLGRHDRALASGVMQGHAPITTYLLELIDIATCTPLSILA